MLLKGKTALVTGGTRGIGKAICQAFVDQGADLIFTYVSSDQKANELQNSLAKKANFVKALKLDGSDNKAVEHAVNNLLSEVDKIDVLVNNAGITKDQLLMRMNIDDWNKILQVNLTSVFNFTKALQRNFLKQRSGSIINLSSIVGIKGNAGQSNYAASKAGIVGFSKSIALELGSRNIRCNVVAPGFIETEMTDKLDEKSLEQWRSAIPLKRGGHPKEVADAVVFLASDMASYISGQVLQIDGALLT